MAFGEGDAWIWWAGIGAVIAVAGIATSMIGHARGNRGVERGGWGVALAASVWMAFSLYQLLA